jgi:5-methylcytosine-specific restriction endonuclease McrA
MQEKEYKIRRKNKVDRCYLRQCFLCNNDFYPTVVNVKKGFGKFCSKICSNKFNFAGEKNGNYGKPVSQEMRDRISKTLTGRIYLERRGENNPLWKGGTTSDYRERRRPRYVNWRKAIYERDNFTCQICFKKGGYLEADHIKPFAYFPQLRFELSNGRTLCKPCHKTTDTYGERAKKLYAHRNNICSKPNSVGLFH